MISARLASFLAQRNIHYGWVVAGVTFLTMLATAAAMGSAGILIEPLQSEFGWTNANISFAMALRLVLFGLMGPFAAAFMNQNVFSGAQNQISKVVKRFEVGSYR